MCGEDSRAGLRIRTEAGIPAFDAPEAAIRAFLNMVQYRHNQDLLYETPRSLSEDVPADLQRIGAVIAAARAAGRTLLTEVEAKELLAAAGIPVTPAVLATPQA